MQLVQSLQTAVSCSLYCYAPAAPHELTINFWCEHNHQCRALQCMRTHNLSGTSHQHALAGQLADAIPLLKP